MKPNIDETGLRAATDSRRRAPIPVHHTYALCRYGHTSRDVTRGAARALTPSGAGLPSGFHKFTHRPRSATALLSAARASSLVVADHARPVLMPVRSERSEEHAGRVGRSSTTLCFEDSNAESLARIAERHRKSRLAGLGIPLSAYDTDVGLTSSTRILCFGVLEGIPTCRATVGPSTTFRSDEVSSNF